LRARLDSVRESIADLLARADQGRILRDGVRVVIYGATNAGKSSLLNRLLGYERVIVSDTHGTTRDTIEEALNLRGVPLRVLDTAGLRTSTSDVESEGIGPNRALCCKKPTCVYTLLTKNAPPPAHFEGSATNGSEILVLNKSDLPGSMGNGNKINALRISCATGDGLTDLEN